MKRIFAIVIALLIVFSFAACTNDKKRTKVTSNSVSESTKDEAVVEVATTPIEGASDSIWQPTPESVEDWIADNQDIVDSYCNKYGYVVSAKGNELIINAIRDEFTNDKNNSLQKVLTEEKSRWASLTKEEKQEELKSYCTRFGEDCDMPVPEKVTENVCNSSGKVLGTIVYEVK